MGGTGDRRDRTRDGGGMTAPLTQFFIGGWGSTDAVWRGTLTQAPRSEPRFLGWLQCVQDWPGVLAALSARPEPCLLVGWSLGSLLSLRAALELPEKIAAMVLVSGTPYMCASKDHGGIDPRTLAAMRVRVARNPGPVLEEFAHLCAVPDGDEETRACYLQQAKQFSAAELAAGLECLAALDVRERLGAIKVPCRVLHGACDRIVPLRSAQFLAEQIPGAELEVLEGHGHALPFTAPAQIARCIASVIS
jgi:pimeloyl-[acyl-carrier protein] methyl ester esterase